MGLLGKKMGRIQLNDVRHVSGSAEFCDSVSRMYAKQEDCVLVKTHTLKGRLVFWTYDRYAPLEPLLEVLSRIEFRYASKYNWAVFLPNGTTIRSKFSPVE